jgi:hypothetical protein
MLAGRRGVRLNRLRIQQLLDQPSKPGIVSGGKQPNQRHRSLSGALHPNFRPTRLRHDETVRRVAMQGDTIVTGRALEEQQYQRGDKWKQGACKNYRRQKPNR